VCAIGGDQKSRCTARIARLMAPGALPEQQPGDHFWILMDPILGSDGEPYVFYLACHDDGERRLLGRYVSPARRFFPHREIVFALRP
jgi:hypothetical protein